jgi:2-polyprenyl-6-hydroxyphenyl methylase/3-demethylubiquinone-9 3-methyltransferase
MEKIDNAIYDRIAETWWDENSMIHILRTAINPARFGYFGKIWKERGLKPSELSLLDVGCGGGFLSEEFAKSGFCVTGVDSSAATLQTAQNHAEQAKLDIKYVNGRAEALPFDDATFDVVTCCDVLEHVSDLDVVVKEIARVLKPGGIFFYDTINRTPLSKFVMIKLFQD